MEDEREVLTADNKLFCKVSGTGLDATIIFKDRRMPLKELNEKALDPHPKTRTGRTGRKYRKPQNSSPR